MEEEVKRQEIINQILLRNQDEVDNESGREFLETLTLEELENLLELGV